MQSGIHRPPPVKDAASPPSAASEKEFDQASHRQIGAERAEHVCSLGVEILDKMMD